MSTFHEKVYHIFTSTGTIIQIECGLNAVGSCAQLVSITNGNVLVVANKRIPMSTMQEEEIEFIHKITDNIYIALTGVYGDVIGIINEAIELAGKLEYEMGCKISADVFVKKFAMKMQKNIQRSNKRLQAFAMHVFGLFEEFNGGENKKSIKLFYTDLSAIEYEMFACASGEDSAKMTTYLEKTYKNDMSENELIFTGINTLLQSIGKEAEHTEIDVVVYDGITTRKLSSVELDKYLQDIAEQ